MLRRVFPKVGEEDEDLRDLARFSFQRAAQNGRKDCQLVTTYFFYQVILYSFQMVFSRMIYFKSFYKVEFEKTGHLIDLPHSPVCTSARWSYVKILDMRRKSSIETSIKSSIEKRKLFAFGKLLLSCLTM